MENWSVSERSLPYPLKLLTTGMKQYIVNMNLLVVNCCNKTQLRLKKIEQPECNYIDIKQV